MSRAVPSSTKSSIIPPLQNGDRLTRAEFERRFDATPNLKKAELIEGVVYMPPPVSFSHHGSPHVDFLALLNPYRIATSGVLAGDNSSLRLDLDNMPQPDAFLMIASERGGQTRIDKDGYVVGGPEFIGEISATTASYDLHAKLTVYRRHGVREYVVWRTMDREIDYFILREGRYDRLPADEKGVWRSEVFPGLWIDGRSLLSGNLLTALKILQEGLASPAHETFVARLSGK